jgi:hypothetical protein
MQSRIGRALGALARTALAMTAKRPAKPSPAQRQEEDRLTKVAMQGFFLYVVLPAWVIPGYGDYLCHKRSKIETTSGTLESITHSLMMRSIAVPTLLSLLFEINALTLVVSAASVCIHELVVLWDVSYASTRRPPNVTEQHIHGFLEVLPILTLSFLLCLRPQQAAAVLGLGPEKPDFTIRPKAEPPSPAYVTALLLFVTTAVGLPYAEELLRCLRANPSPLPRPKRPGFTE